MVIHNLPEHYCHLPLRPSRALREDLNSNLSDEKKYFLTGAEGRRYNHKRRDSSFLRGERDSEQ
jgi:hypothetical protein